MAKRLNLTFNQQKLNITFITGVVIIAHFSILKMLNFNQYVAKISNIPNLEISFINNSGGNTENIKSNLSPQIQPIPKVQPVIKKNKALMPPLLKPEIKPKPKVNIEKKTQTQVLATTNINSNNLASINKASLKTNTILNESNNEFKKNISPKIESLSNNNIASNTNNTPNNQTITNNNVNINNNKDTSKEVSGTNGSTQGASYQGGIPIYPENARDNEIEGTVILKILISIDGKAKAVQMLKSSGNKELDNAALEHIQGKGNRFKPSIKNGEAIESWKILPIQFKLD